MKRFLLLTALLAITATAMSGKSISRSQALDNANKYCAERGINITIAATAQPARVQATTAMAEQPYYVFSTNDAFVIAAGDDEYPAVLGYSDNGAFDPDDVPEALQELLMQYADIIANDGVGDIIVTPSRDQSWVHEPLCKSTWSQEAPYNNQCPEVATGVKGVTGCVATAMGQVMYYHRWPNKPTKNIPAYTTRTKGISIAELSTAKYPAWSSLQDYYTSKSTNTEAIGWFMRYVWQSVKTDFEIGESGAYLTDVPNALTSYFDYDRTAHYVYQYWFTHTGWFDLVTKELNNRRPILYSGSQYLGEGHAFIIDGMNSDGMVHVNWGWGGSGNGYFALTYLNPKSQGTGLPGGQGYNYNNAMVVDIRKSTGSSAKAYFSCYDVSTSASTVTLTAINFSPFDVSSFFANTYTFSQQASIGWACEYDGELHILASKDITLQGYGGTYQTMSIKLPGSLPVGVHTIYPVCKPQGATYWERATGDAGYLTVSRTAVQKNVARITYSGSKAPLNYTISNVKVGSRREKWCNLEVTATLTNNGSSNIADTYLLFDFQPMTHAICDAESGTSANLTWNFTPKSSGRHYISISLDPEGDNLLYNATIDINEASDAIITSTNGLTVANANAYKITGNTFKATATLNNIGTTNYDDYLYANLYTASSPNALLYQQKKYKVTLNSGATKTVTVTFDNLPPGVYCLNLSYYKYGQLYLICGSADYTILGSYATGDVNGDGTVDISDVNAIINIILGTAASSYKGNADVNGDGSVDIADVNAIINIILG